MIEFTKNSLLYKLLKVAHTQIHLPYNSNQFKANPLASDRLSRRLVRLIESSAFRYLNAI